MLAATRVGSNLPIQLTKTWIRGPYMSAHDLLNLLNKLKKSNKMWGSLSILSLFCNEFNQFSNIGAQMLLLFDIWIT